MVDLEGDITVRDGHLALDGVDVVELAGRVATPFFVFSPRRIRWNVSSLVNAFTRRHLDTEIFFASKACSNLWFLDEVRRAGINVEVNSGGELLEGASGPASRRGRSSSTASPRPATRSAPPSRPASGGSPSTRSTSSSGSPRWPASSAARPRST